MKNFGEEKSGQALEVELLGTPNYEKYKNTVTEKLIDDQLKSEGRFLTAKEIQGNKEIYNEYLGPARLELVKNTRNLLFDSSGETLIDIVKKSQRSESPRPFIQDMKRQLAQDSGLDISAINFYTAVGTNLDYCNVDGIFEFKLGRNLIRINIDLTEKPHELKQKELYDKQADPRAGRILCEVILSTEGNKDYVRERDEKLIRKFSRDILLFVKQYKLKK